MSETTPPTPPAVPPHQQPIVIQTPEPKRTGWLKRIFTGLLAMLLILSIVMNVYLAAIVANTMAGPMEQVVLREGSEEEQIAVFEVSGTITDASAASFGRFARLVMDDATIKGVVIRVETPGGAVAPSDQIYKDILDLQAAGRPVVISMGGVAASGGYYISAPADMIYAEHTTTTGSIGVIAGWLVISGTLDKLGMEPVVMKSTAARGWKDEISPLQKPDRRQREHLQSILDSMQQRFEMIVRQGRGDKLALKEKTYEMEVEVDGETRTVSHTETIPLNGKVYIGPQAKEVGLVDKIGYFDDAVQEARDLAGAPKARVVQYRPRRGVMHAILYGDGQASTPQTPILTREFIEEIRTPRIEMIWRVE
ncbi:MAG: S49 family peptidase [Phycisphaerae bacterium]